MPMRPLRRLIVALTVLLLAPGSAVALAIPRRITPTARRRRAVRDHRLRGVGARRVAVRVLGGEFGDWACLAA